MHVLFKEILIIKFSAVAIRCVWMMLNKLSSIGDLINDYDS